MTQSTAILKHIARQHGLGMNFLFLFLFFLFFIELKLTSFFLVL